MAAVPVTPWGAGSITLPDSVDYQTGSLTSIQGATDRVVIAYSYNVASPSSRVLVIGVSGE